MVTLYNVIDTRTGKFHSEVIVKKRMVRFFVPDIEIHTELTDWIEVEPGGTVTFQNSDESKQLPVPNAVSLVRKLDEVN